MPCHGGSSCNFCGCEVLVWRVISVKGDQMEKRSCKSTLLFSWLSSAEILNKKGKIIQADNNELSHQLSDKDFKYYSNVIDYREETHVFLHTFCRIYIQKHTGWDLRTIYKVLMISKEPYVVRDNQYSMFLAMKYEGVPIWRAVSPKISKDNQEFFWNRLLSLKQTFELDDK